MGVTIDGKYRVDALIGRGGMGAVYRARDTRLDRDVAVKVVRGELVASTEARERFKREAQLAARLQHPSIVTVFDYGTLPDGSAYLVMEYVRGEDLRARLARGALDWKDAVRLLAAVADGVDAAHREQILHRDLKPENVLLPESGGPPKVLDFGVAKMMAAGRPQGTVTAGATIVGTPAYMAPEQMRGERGGSAHRHLQPGGDGVRDADRPTAVRRRDRSSTSRCGNSPTSRTLDAAPLPERMTGVLGARCRSSRRGGRRRRWRLPRSCGRRSANADAPRPGERSQFIAASCRSISATACPICSRRTGCVVASSCRCSSVRASRSDSNARARSGIHLGPAVARGLAAFFEFFHALLQARVSVNQSFSSITHEYRRLYRSPELP